MDAQTALGIANEEMLNSLSGLAANLTNDNPFAQIPGVQLSQTDTLFINNRWYLISNLWQLLSQLYVEHGIVQTLVDQPVDDAFRAGFEIKTSQLSKDEIDQLHVYDQRNGVTRSLMQARKWARLYGGGAVLIITGQDPSLPLDIKKIKPGSPLEFRSIDMWELYYTTQNISGTIQVGGAIGSNMGEFYDYYGHKIHKSHVYRVIGKECPAYLRPRLRGWGMSELERIVRSLNSYMKNQDVIFALLDEAKVDVYRMKGFNSSLMSAQGTAAAQTRIQLANALKGFNNALMMDVEDEYDQKQIAFSGLAEILLQLRQGLAADLKMPMTKLFGVSAAGFSSGEDDIENYNSMLEGEIRAKDKFAVVDLLQIACQHEFGTMIDDLMIEFNPLRILNAKEEEEVKDSQLNRIMSVYQSGLVADTKVLKEAINKDSLIGVEVDVNSESAPPLEGDFTVQGAAKGAAGKQAKADA
jgi:phage-related protein (TIGR01555 family)